MYSVRGWMFKHFVLTWKLILLYMYSSVVWFGFRNVYLCFRLVEDLFKLARGLNLNS